MTTTATKREEALVIVDQEGRYYAIPREVVEQYRATGEQKAEIEALRGADVTGYGDFGPAEIFIHEQTVGDRLAERREEASRERLVHATQTATRSAAAAAGEHQPGFINVVAAFTGWLTLRDLGPGTR